jgi:nicotinamide mononucleotide transporter
MDIQAWVQNHWLEISGSLLALISIYLQIKQNVWYWPVSIVMVIVYAIVYYQTGFYADMSLQIYFCVVGIYGWYNWMFSGKSKEFSRNKHLNVSKLGLNGWISSILASIIFYIIIVYILINHTDSTVPYGDAFTTALSFTATYLLARKLIENWIFWLVADVVSVGLYIYKGLYPTAILFTILSILAIFGYRAWKKEMK